jgi:hypothetical protein
MQNPVDNKKQKLGLIDRESGQWLKLIQQINYEIHQMAKFPKVNAQNTQFAKLRFLKKDFKVYSIFIWHGILIILLWIVNTS